MWVKTGEEGFILATALLFGKDEVIQNILPAYKTDALVRIVNTDRYDDRLEVRTNLIESYDLLMDFIRKHLPDPFFLENDQRISLRDKIFREVIANTLVHREFLNSFPSRLVIEKEKVVIENWNKPYIPGTINPDNFYTHLKNPIILEVFKQIGRADELGSGVRNVFKYGKMYGKSNPIFEESDVFKTIIFIPKIYNLKTEDGTDRSTGSNTFTFNENKTKIKGDGINDGIIKPVTDITRQLLIKIVLFVYNQPGCNADDIAAHINRSIPATERYIITLRKLNMVEYTGAKKTGGYYLTPQAKEKIKL